MKKPPRSLLRPTSAAAGNIEEIEEIRARLVRAQNEENQAIRKLGRLTAHAQTNKTELDRLMAHAKATRERAIAVYDELAKLLDQIEKRRDGGNDTRNGKK